MDIIQPNDLLFREYVNCQKITQRHSHTPFSLNSSMRDHEVLIAMVWLLHKEHAKSIAESNLSR